MANPQHIEWLKEGVKAWNARRKRDDFIPDFEGFYFNRIFPPKSIRQPLQDFAPNFSNANMRNAEGIGLVFIEADFTGADLRHADFASSNFSDANFSDCILTDARFEYADFRGAKFNAARAAGANFDNANLNRADFRGADLRRARLKGTQKYNTDVSGVDLTQTLGIEKKYYTRMFGDRHTKLPDRLPFPPEWDRDGRDILPSDQPDHSETPTPLNAPLVKASAVDFAITETGAEAVPPEGQDLRDYPFSGDCLQRASALSQGARDIASSISNKLGEDTRADLIRYADHLDHSEDGNPHRLVSLAVGIRADVEDPFMEDALGRRLNNKLSHFLEQHDAFLSCCLPLTAEAVATKADTVPSRDVSKEEVTEILDRLEAAITRAEAATESVSQVLSGMRAHDDALNNLAIKAFSDHDIAKLRKAVQRETVEIGTITSRLYWRAQQVVSRTRDHAGDLAIAGTLTGKTAPDMAQAIMTQLDPLMRLLQELLTALPPI